MYNMDESLQTHITTKKVKLNIIANKKTLNSRIYRKQDLINAFDKLLEKSNVPIVRNSSELFTYKKNEKDEWNRIQRVKISDIIGIFLGYEINEEGEIYIKVKPMIDTGLFDCCLIGTSIIGNIRDDRTVDIDSIIGFYIAGNVDIVDRNMNPVEPDNIMQKELIIITGNIGCGKSTSAREDIGNLRDYIIVNDDAISTMIGGGIYTNYDKDKKDLYKNIELMCVEIGLKSGYNVIVDMPNMKIKSRKPFIEIGKKFRAKIISYNFGPGKEKDLQRRLNEDRGYDKWKEAFLKKQKEYEKPSIDEGFDEIIGIEIFK